MTTAAWQPSWDGSELSAGRLADALTCTRQTAEALLLASASPNLPAGIRRVGLAIASALHHRAGIALPVAAAIVRERRSLCQSVLATLDFFPPAGGHEGCAERDPFMFFVPHATAASAVPAVDEFIDVMDGRRIRWRRPARDACQLASELHRLSEAARQDDGLALREEYLDLLSQVRGPAPQVSEWIGTIRDGVHSPAPERFAEPTPGMRQGIDIEGVHSQSASAYGTCVSVNVSLAARCFKRRMLGLAVTDPFATTMTAGQANEGAAVRA